MLICVVMTIFIGCEPRKYQEFILDDDRLEIRLGTLIQRGELSGAGHVKNGLPIVYHTAKTKSPSNTTYTTNTKPLSPDEVKSVLLCLKPIQITNDGQMEKFDYCVWYTSGKSPTTFLICVHENSLGFQLSGTNKIYEGGSQSEFLERVRALRGE